MTNDYVINHIAWPQEIKGQLVILKKDMDDFGNKIRQPRFKIIAHSDVETFRKNNVFGEFNAGEDESFFNNLHKFIGIAEEASMKKPFPGWPKFIEADVLLLAKSLGVLTGDL